MSTILCAAVPPADNAAGGGWIFVAVEFGLIFFVFYLFVIKPQGAEKKRIETMRSNIHKGDRVVTAGGIHAVVSKIDNEKKTVTLQVSDKVQIEFSLSAIATVLKQGNQDPQQ